MKKRLLMYVGAFALLFATGCAYTGAVASPDGKLYITRTAFFNLLQTGYTCEPSGDALNCAESAIEGAGGGEAAPAAGGEAQQSAEGAAAEGEKAADEAAAE